MQEKKMRAELTQVLPGFQRTHLCEQVEPCAQLSQLELPFGMDHWATLRYTFRESILVALSSPMPPETVCQALASVGSGFGDPTKILALCELQCVEWIGRAVDMEDHVAFQLFGKRSWVGRELMALVSRGVEAASYQQVEEALRRWSLSKDRDGAIDGEE